MSRTIAMFLLGLVLVNMSGCVTGPDARPTLSPAAREFGERQLEHVLTCGVQAALSAAVSAAAGGSGAPDYVRASQCHINLLREQLTRGANRRPLPSREPSNSANRCSGVVHGQLVLEVATLEQAGEHREARKVARQCDRLVRTCWLDAHEAHDPRPSKGQGGRDSHRVPSANTQGTSA